MAKIKHYGNVEPLNFKHIYERKLYSVLSDMRFPLMTIILFTTIGVLGLMIINGKTDGKSVLDYLFHVVITFTTIGYTEGYVENITANRLFMSMFLLIAFPLAYFYGLAATVQVIINGNLKEVFRYWRMYKSMEKLKNHFIICSYNNTTSEIIKRFKERKIDFILAENDPSKEKMIIENGVEHYVIAEPHFRSVLLGMGIEQAQGLITAFSENTQDISVIVTARLIMPDKDNFHIIATSSNENEADKMKLLGANEVIVPEITTGRRILSYALRPPTPLVSMLLDKLAYGGDRKVDIFELKITENCCKTAKNVGETGISALEGVSVIALSDENGKIVIGPKDSMEIKPGDTLIILGKPEQIDNKNKRFEVCG